MSDSAQREWRFYLDDMIEFAGKVIAYTEGLDQAGFSMAADCRHAQPLDSQLPRHRQRYALEHYS